MATSSDQPLEVFISYAHEDETLCQELIKHLKPLIRQGKITIWSDHAINAGTEWESEILHHLGTAPIILLLVSPDFMASDYCNDVELAQAMQRHDAGQARVIPVFLREANWQGAIFGKLQALPKGAVPIMNWSNRDQAFVDAAKGIQRAIEDMAKVRSLAIPNDSLTATPVASATPSAAGLTDSQRRRLGQELERLQDEYDLLSTKLKRLRKARMIEVDVAVQLKLDVQIEETEAELSAVEQKLNEVEQKLS